MEAITLPYYSKSLSNRLLHKRLLNLLLPKRRRISIQIFTLSGYWPNDIFLYKLSLRHHSAVAKTEISAASCNERLEYLGDAVLNQIVAEHLFKRYPLKDEGFLTEMRSKIVNRATMNQLAILIGLDKLVIHQLYRKKIFVGNQVIFGNALEAFIGALYLDRGMKAATKFILNRLLSNYLTLKELEAISINPKNKIIEFATKQKLGKISYQVVENKYDIRHRFSVTVLLNDKPVATGNHIRKKDAEQLASEIALHTLQQQLTEKNITENNSDKLTEPVIGESQEILDSETIPNIEESE